MGNTNQPGRALDDRKLGGYPDGFALVDQRGQDVLKDGLMPVLLPKPVVITVTPVVDTNALAANDLAVATLTRLQRVGKPGGTTVLQQVMLLDKDLESVATELWFFDTVSVTLPALNAAWSISDANAERCVGVVNIATTDYFATALNSVAIKKQMGLSMKLASDSTDLWAAIITRGGPTYTAASDLTFTFTFYPDA